MSLSGGDGGGLSKSTVEYRRDKSSIFDHKSGDSGGRNYNDNQRMYLGGKMPNWNHPKHRKSSHHSSGHHHSSSRRHYDSSSESSSDSSRDHKGSMRSRGSRGSRGGSRYLNSDEDDNFKRYEGERLRKERDSIQPLDAGAASAVGGSVRDKASRRDMLRADATPLAVDSQIGFANIGGLDTHVAALKEMVVLPLLYPDVFSRFDTQPPRGVLFVGPPGTGKTLTARALANSLSAGSSSGGRRVSFFMRKGADCLSKWVGEGERQLRLLFEQAKRYQPSIIFFDEIDGLAPVRSVKQDQIHASIVSTLLALMDGLDSRGQVVVIGATNRPDAIDPALRRPGRFDRELLFPLPGASARAAILDIQTKSWQPPLDGSFKKWIVASTVGYCGADMKALCAEAALVALRRAYPQVYESSQRLQLDPLRLCLGRGDFAAALHKVVPSSHRSVGTPAAPLSLLTKPLLTEPLQAAIEKLSTIFPYAVAIDDATGGEGASLATGGSSASVADRKAQKVAEIERIKRDSEIWISAITDCQERGAYISYLEGAASAVNSIYSDGLQWSSSSLTSSPRLLLHGKKNMGQAEVAAAVLQHLEALPCYQLSLPSLIADIHVHTPEQALVQRFQEAVKAAPAVLYLPDLTSWWRSAGEGARTILVSLVETCPQDVPVLWLSTCCSLGDDEVQGAGDDAAGLGQECAHDARYLSLLRQLSGHDNTKAAADAAIGRNAVELRGPSLQGRQQLFRSFFSELPELPAKVYAARMKIYLSRCQNVLIAKTSTESGNSKCSAGGGAKPDAAAAYATRSRDQKTADGRLGLDGESGGGGVVADFMVPMEIDSDSEARERQSLRDLRTFQRASLSELSKEKRCHAFLRPVDPEVVPDYYDIIQYPMDIETMRMKVS